MKTWFKRRIILAICLFFYTVNCIGTELNVDSLKYARSLKQKADFLFAFSKTDSAIFYQKESLKVMNDLVRKYPFDNQIIGELIIGKSLNELILFSINKSDTFEAKNDSLIASAQLLFGENSYVEGKTLLYYGVTLVESSEYDKAKQKLLRSLDILSSQATVSKEPISRIHQSIGASYAGLGDFEKAIHHFTNSLNIRRSLNHAKQPEEVITLKKMGLVYLATADYEKALEFLNESLFLSNEVFGEIHTEGADIINNLGNLFFRSGYLGDALGCFIQALETRLKLFGSKHPDVSASYNNVGVILSSLNDFDAALGYHMKALEINKELFGENHISVATSYNNLANDYSYLGYLDRAKELYLKALEIRTSVLGDNHPAVAQSYVNLGIVYNTSGQYSKSLEYFFKAKEIRKIRFGEMHPQIASIYHNMGMSYVKLENYQMAIDYFSKALRIRLDVFGEINHNVANTLNNLGYVYEKVGDNLKALSKYEQSLDINIQLVGDRHETVAASYFNIGSVFLNEKDFDKAEEFFEKSLKTRLNVFGKFNPLTSRSYLKLGLLKNETGHFFDAIEKFRKALDSNLALFDIDNVIVESISFEDALNLEVLLETIYGIASSYIGIYQEQKTNYDSTSNNGIWLNRSLKFFEIADIVIDKYFYTLSNASDAILLIEKAQEIYSKAITASLQLYKESSNQSFLEKAYYFSSTNKARLLLRELNTLYGLQYANVPDSLTKLEFSLRFQINTLKQQMASEQESEKLSVLRNRSFKLNRDYENLISHLENNFPKFIEIKYKSEIPSISKVQNEYVEPGTAIIDFHIFGDGFVVFLITKDSLYAFEGTFHQSIYNMVDGFRLGLNQVTPQKYLMFAYELYDLFFSPMRQKLSGVNKLLIIPTDALYHLPFEAILTHEVISDNGIVDFSTLPYLIHDYEISYSYSIGLHSFQKSMPKNLNLDGIAAFAPVFDYNEELEDELLLLSSNSSNLLSDLEEMSIPSFLRFKELKYSLEEVRNIERVFGAAGIETKAFIRSDATKENFINYMGHYKIMHVASHSFFNDIQPELSGIAFYQTSRTNLDEIKEGVLFSPQIYSLDCNIDLLVLSGCESGTGKIYKGEGIMSFIRGFLHAGVKNLVYSLWKVYDKPSSEIMTNFYENYLQNMRFAEALRKSKIRMINDPRMAHPIFWSGFVFLGID